MSDQNIKDLIKKFNGFGSEESSEKKFEKEQTSESSLKKQKSMNELIEKFNNFGSPTQNLKKSDLGSTNPSLQKEQSGVNLSDLINSARPLRPGDANISEDQFNKEVDELENIVSEIKKFEKKFQK